MKKWFVRIVILGVLTMTLVFFLNYLVVSQASDKIYTEASETPVRKVGLLLGTGKFVGGGWVNLFYKHRIEAAVALYNAGRINYILISGDNSREGYNEPTSMKEDLMAAGIPENAIYLDYAGFRTLDSIVRCKEIFGETDITVISQQFHNERAIYLAESNGMKAIGYNATDISGRYGLKTHLREYLARTKMFLDILMGKKPKFLGESVDIG
jgi:SanA protein